jgi:hypothetical protein
MTILYLKNIIPLANPIKRFTLIYYYNSHLLL